MAIREQLSILQEGVIVWNTWRTQNQQTPIDLSGANFYRSALVEAALYRADFNGIDLHGANLSRAGLIGIDLIGANLSGAGLSEAGLQGANLSRANLSRANLSGANLSGANLSRANLSRTDLIGANLNGANLNEVILSGANLNGADLIETNLRGADLRGADLRGTDLSKADFSGAILIEANLSGAILHETNLSRAIAAGTIFGKLDLRMVKGLETIEHHGPSEISTSTLEKSGGEIPENFLKGAGVGSTLIDYARSLFGKPIEYYTCFLSYSSKDEEFVKRLYADLQSNGVRCWFAPHSMRPGTVIVRGIDEAIRLYDKLLLILSQHSVESTWVEFEVAAALEKERERQHETLFPIRLDDTVLTTSQPWAAGIRRQRHIGDFTQWKDYDAYQQVFDRLLHDLKTSATKENH